MGQGRAMFPEVPAAKALEVIPPCPCSRAERKSRPDSRRRRSPGLSGCSILDVPGLSIPEAVAGERGAACGPGPAIPDQKAATETLRVRGRPRASLNQWTCPCRSLRGRARDRW